ncbi:hypothetical protein [Streptomyces sp. PA5.6]|uniref:hypothetical protein n=1 Tax=Streptomyces sp. PA5.6 TaxID=3035651 RepID=UPI003904AD7F
MIDTESSATYETPAAVASAVLDAIEALPDAFNMGQWVSLPGMLRLAPEETPARGSQLCAAAWAAHLTGWTLVSLPYEDWVTYTDADGDKCEALTSVYAERSGERRLIRDVATEALGLRPHETLWYESAPAALKQLHEIAGRSPSPRPAGRTGDAEPA